MNLVSRLMIAGCSACLLALLAASWPALATTQGVPASQAASQPRGAERWESTIAGFEAYDRKNTPQSFSSVAPASSIGRPP